MYLGQGTWVVGGPWHLWEQGAAWQCNLRSAAAAAVAAAGRIAAAAAGEVSCSARTAGKDWRLSCPVQVAAAAAAAAGPAAGPAAAGRKTAAASSMTHQLIVSTFCPGGDGNSHP